MLCRSGKSYTLLGDQGTNRGVTARSVESLLNLIKSESRRSLEVRASFLQVHKDSLSDLTQNSSRGIKLSESQYPFIENANEKSVTSLSDFTAHLRQSLKNRVTGETSFLTLLSLYERYSTLTLISQIAFIELPRSDLASISKRPLDHQENCLLYTSDAADE